MNGGGCLKFAGQDAHDVIVEVACELHVPAVNRLAVPVGGENEAVDAGSEGSNPSAAPESGMSRGLLLFMRSAGTWKTSPQGPSDKSISSQRAA